jgi:hypothetical protein
MFRKIVRRDPAKGTSEEVNQEAESVPVAKDDTLSKVKHERWYLVSKMEVFFWLEPFDVLFYAK